MGDTAGPRRTISRGLEMLSSDEESRAYLQGRLRVLSELMFWSFVVLLTFMALMYWWYPDLKPRHEDVIVYLSTAGLVLLACTWRLALVRRKLSIDALYGIDRFYAVGTGLILGASGYLARDFPISGPACLLYTALMVLLRAILVPSSGPRTAVVATLTFIPTTISAVLVGVKMSRDLMPAPAYITGAVLISAVVVMMATVGSRIIYGLRRQVSEAMQLGQYTLDRQIGAGGMGAVYRAHHALLRRPTAIKLLLPDRVGAKNLDRFEREVQHMSLLTHPNTVAVFDYGRNLAGVFYYAMEYLDGIDLEQMVQRFGPQPAGRVIAIVTQVCGALSEAHDRGIIHRDIKPANIILCERGGMADVAKVVDFGLVKELADTTGRSTQAILGTPGYLAPEAVTDPGSIGPAVDIYGLGAVAYFLLTGELVFTGATPMDICIQHVKLAPVPPSQRGVGVPPELEQLVMRCLAKRAEDRPTAPALAKLLRALPAETAAGAWDEDAARQWWREFRTDGDGSTVAPGPEPTMMITVDLGERAKTEVAPTVPMRPPPPAP